jgi:hypothetical protein
MKHILAPSLAAVLALVAWGAGHAGEPRTAAETVRRYVLDVDGMT